MASDKQIEANRNNALMSCGPRTQAGKDSSRLNSIKHGLRADTLSVLPDEDADQFAGRVNAWFDDLQPATQYEVDLTRQAALLSWKLDRADRYEVAILSKHMTDAMAACDHDHPVGHAEAAALASFDPSNEGERLRRYQFSLLRELRRTLDSFSKQRIQAAKLAEQRARTSSETPNEPNLDPPTAPNEPNWVAEEAMVGVPNEPNLGGDTSSDSAPNEPNPEADPVLQECQAHENDGTVAPNEPNPEADPIAPAPDLLRRRRIDPKRLIQARRAQMQRRAVPA